MPVLEMDAIALGKALTHLAAALRELLAAKPEGIDRHDLFRAVIEMEKCYEDDLILALSRLGCC